MNKGPLATVNVAEAKAKLSEYLDLVVGGGRVVICKRNQPVAELRGLPPRRVDARPIGKAAGRLVVPPAFFEPLPDDVAALFAGEESAAGDESPEPARAAERPPAYHAGRRARPRR